VDAALARAAFRQNKVELYAGVPARAGTAVRSLAEADLSGRCGLAIGNEARGVGAELRSVALDISIPTGEWNRSTPPWRPASCCTKRAGRERCGREPVRLHPPGQEGTPKHTASAPG